MRPTNAPDLANLSPEAKRQLLTQLLHQQGQQQAAALTPQTFPLSFAQQRLWFIDQLEPGQTVYTIPAALRLQGQLQVELLHRCLNEIVGRHEILRTRFVAETGAPFQVIATNASIDLPVVALTLDPAARHHDSLLTAHLSAHLQALVTQPFDLATGPLLRCQLLCLGDNDHVLVLTVHHIVADYWSLRLLMREIMGLYPAWAQGQASPLPTLPIQYADYAAWQRQQPTDWLQAQLDYWLQQLAHPPTLLPLPTDYPRPAVQTFRGARCSFVLTQTLTDALTALAQQYQATLFMTLLAGFKALLYRYTGQSDIWVGSTVTNRDRPELQNLIGLFVNNLVFRSQVTADLSFIQLLAQVKATALEAYAHQDIPFEQVVDVLQVERQLSHNALFQVMFILHNTPRTAVTLSDLTITALELTNNAARFDLSLDMYETEAGLTGVFEYNTDLFAADTIERLVGHFETLLTSLVTQPDQAIGQLPLLTSTELETWAVWNQTATTIPAVCAHQLFEAQAETAGDAIALTTDHSLADNVSSPFVIPEVPWTYRRLNQRANQVARYLQRQGAGYGNRIALALERSADLVIAILAVHKLGGTYIPLDPTHPPERRQHVLEDAGVAFLLTAGAEVSAAPAGRFKIIDLSTATAQIEHQPSDNLAVPVVPEDVAYIIYTSGSTGQPKGVPIRHRSLVNLLTSMAQSPGMTADDALLAVTTVAFDIATLELLLPLTVGARLVIASSETICDASRLSAQIASDEITIMQATPATWRILLESGWIGEPHLKIFCGGEALDLVLAQQLLPCCRELWNMYGPTETTIWSGALRINAEDLTGPTVPIGGPINNTQFHILDHHCQPVPIGIPGELHISGAGLSCGYLNRPDLTAETFISPAFTPASQPTGTPDATVLRLYKTGDRVRYRPSGTLEYLGRLDHQIKLRGFRIEPGEIEATLAQHPDLEQAVVDLWQGAVDEPQLVAYCKVGPETELTAEDLRQFLSQRLPAYMLPTVYVVLAEFPLTPNGKLDRNALPEPTLGGQGEGEVSPQTPTEQLLAQIWSEILNQSAIGTNDNFFALGGHSLLAARVIARLQSTLATTVPLRALFEYPVLSDFARVIDVAQTRNVPPPLQRTSRQEPLPLSFAQQRQWVLAQLEPDSGFYNIPAAVRLEGDFSRALLAESLAVLCQRHEGLRSRFVAVAGTAELVIEPQVQVAVPVIDLADAMAETIQQRLKTEAQRPFDLATAPLLRVQVMQIGPQVHVVSLVLHHIVADAGSVGLLVRELITVYRQLRAQQAVDLPPLPIQYVDYAAWQQTLDTRDQLTYWQQQLADAPPLLPLPTDYPRPAIQQFTGGNYRFTVSAEQTTALKQLSQQHDATLFMTLLAAFQLLLYRYSGATDVLVGTPVAHRPQAALEGVLGMFVNTLVLRSDFSGDLSCTELLQQVRATALAAYANQDVPFEQVIDALNVPRNWSYAPLFQVMFVWQAAMPPLPAARDQLEGLTWNVIELHSNTAKVDLTLSMTEDHGGLRGQFEYRQDLFAAGTIEAMAEASVAALPLLPPRQQQQLAQWNDTARPYSTDQCLHHLFEQQVQRTPTVTALIAQDQRLTYQELDACAHNLAQSLQTLGVGLESRVGLCLDRGPDLVIAILAVLKAGGAYVPLDPAYPQTRLAHIVADAEVGVILTQQKHAGMTQGHGGAIKVVVLDGSPQALAHPASLVSSPVRPDHLVYIIYTSGSTGRPKGVAIEHHSPVTLVHWAQEVFSAAQLAGVLASTSICFDLSVFEIFVPLSCGGTVILAEDVLQVPHLPARAEITLINTVPTAIAELWRMDGIPSGVSTINLAGEPIPPILVQQLYAVESVQKVYNLYGPSEDTTYSTATLLTTHAAGVPIGWPIANTQVHVLDEYDHPVPIGMPGELYLAGDGVARGYWQQPQLTAERFIVREPQGTRLYKTGDRVRYRPDGQLEFLGRLDSQVKLRGFRIELGEVEAVLLQHPEIMQAAASIWTDAQAHRRLVAYIVWAGKPEGEWGVALTAEGGAGVQSYLRQILPTYMLPALYVPLKNLPCFPNGKLDRRALPAPIWPEAAVAATRPRTVIETQLVDIWQDLLQQPVGIDDNFFALGGDSILAIQAVAKAQQVGLSLVPRDLFQQSTVAQLATVVKPQASASQAPIVGPVPLTPIQHWFFEQSLQHPHHWNQAVLLKVQEALQPELLTQSLHLLMAHHDGLRATFHATATGWQQQYGALSDRVPLTFIRRAVADVEADLVVVANSVQASFNLATGPLWHLVYFDYETPTGPERRLLIVCHHLVVDGISWRILLADLQLIYTQLAQTGTAQLPPKTLSCLDWTQQLMAGDRTAELPYWQQIAGAALPPLPTDFATGSNTMAQAETVTVALAANETQRLLQEVPAAYNVQINDLLLTALGLALKPWVGECLRIAVEGHGRPDDVDLSRTVGWLTTLYPLLLTLPASNLGYGAAIKAVKETRRAVPLQGIGYGVLCALQPQDCSLVAETPIRFNYLGQTDQLLAATHWFTPAAESTGIARSPHDPRDVLIEINAVVSRAQLQLHWTYSRGLYRPDTMMGLAQAYLEQLIALVEYCLSSDTDQGYSPADFPQMALAQDELDQLLEQLDVIGVGGEEA